jgi:hypothetical protein
METTTVRENQNIRININKRIVAFTNDIKKFEDLYEKTNEKRYLSSANNIRARRGELQFVTKIWL